MFLHMSVILFARGACMAGGVCGKGVCVAKGGGGHVCRRNDHWSGRYASYWNAFLVLILMVWFAQQSWSHLLVWFLLKTVLTFCSNEISKILSGPQTLSTTLPDGPHPLLKLNDIPARAHRQTDKQTDTYWWLTAVLAPWVEGRPLPGLPDIRTLRHPPRSPDPQTGGTHLKHRDSQ